MIRLQNTNYNPSKKERSCADNPPVFAPEEPTVLGGGAGETEEGRIVGMGWRKLPLDEGKGCVVVGVREGRRGGAKLAVALACCASIVDCEEKRLWEWAEAPGGGKASGSGEGGSSHRPRAAAVSKRLRVRE